MTSETISNTVEPSRVVLPEAGSTTKLDAVVVEAIDKAREAAERVAGDFGVGEHRGIQGEADRIVTHFFECPHSAYRGWFWAVTLVRAARAKQATVNEVALLPGEEALLAPGWIPWRERIQAGDIAPGTVMPTPDNDPRLDPGYTGGELAKSADPAEWSQTRAVVAELGLGRERVLSDVGRTLASQRWLAGDGGPDNPSSRLAPATCVTCGYFVRLNGKLGTIFGACANEYSPYDAQVVSVDHGCGGHSDVVADERGVEHAEPVFDTIEVDGSLFD